MVFVVREQTGGAPSAIVSVAAKLGVHREALRNWACQAEVDDRRLPGVPSVERERIVQLERETVSYAERTRT